MAAVDETEHVNEVLLVGRLAAEAVEREMPSGDLLTQFRLVVDRPAEARRSASVDTLDCGSWRADVRRSLASWTAGDVVEVHGAVRRRFWQTAGGAVSRYEIEVQRARRIARVRRPRTS